MVWALTEHTTVCLFPPDGMYILWGGEYYERVLHTRLVNSVPQALNPLQRGFSKTHGLQYDLISVAGKCALCKGK